MQSKKEMPLEHKPILTIREASFYTGISEEKLIEITNLYACPFVLWMGNRRFIKRKAFEKFIQTSEFKGGADDEQRKLHIKHLIKKLHILYQLIMMFTSMMESIQ